MGKTIMLSIQKENKRGVQELDRRIAEHPELDELEVTEEMDAALSERIRRYEEEKADEERIAREVEEKLRRREERILSDGAEGSGKGGADAAGSTDCADSVAGRCRKKAAPDMSVEFADEIMPDLSRVHGRFSAGGSETETAGKPAAESASEGIGGGKVLYRKKKRKYVLVALAAVLVLVLGSGMTSVGSKAYWKVLWERIAGGQTMKVMNVEDMEEKVSEDGEEITAYKQIEEQLKIYPVRITYKPANMKLVDYNMNEEVLRAQLLYKYKNEIIRYNLYINDMDSSWVENEEDAKVNEYIITVNGVDIKVVEYDVPDDTENRQEANFKYQGVHYQLKGVMEKEEFEKILKNLHFI